MRSRARATEAPDPRLEWRANPAAAREPLAWGLLGEKAGDNRQVEQLVEALGYPSEIKHLAFRALQHLPNFLVGASNITVQSRGSAALQSPWPDVVISAGRRTVPVARFIRERSAGRTRLVHLGRPRAALDLFDLVITTPQYGLPPHPRLIENTLPFQSANPPAAEMLARWSDEFAALPRPWIGLLVGGESWPLRFSTEAAAALGTRASDAAAARGGSLLVTTSPRTESDETAALFRALRGPVFRNDWHTDRPGCYPSILSLADEFIVTADSISMIAEACRTDRPVEIYPLDRRGGPWGWLADHWSARGSGDGTMSAIVAALARSGVLTPPRNVQRIADELLARGAAKAFDPRRAEPNESASGTETQPGSAVSFHGEMEDTLARIHDLVAAARAEAGPR